MAAMDKKDAMDTVDTPAAAARDLVNAIEALRGARDAFRCGDPGAGLHSNERHAALSIGLEALARMHGVEISRCDYVEWRDSYSLTAPDGFCTLAAALNAHSPRTSMSDCGVLGPASTRCELNHFDAERLVCSAYPHAMAAIMYGAMSSAAPPAGARPMRRTARV